jgi:biotin carboxyl carrier protein
MKIDLTLQNGSASGDHQIELTPSANGPAAGGRLQFALDGESGEADWAEIGPGVYSILIGGRSHELRVTARRSDAGGALLYDVSIGPRTYHLEVRDPRRRRRAGPEREHEGPQEILAPMPGKIVRVLVAENQEVEQGQGLLVIEAMKMQNELRAPGPGRVEKIYVAEGTGVEAGFKLLRLV